MNQPKKTPLPPVLNLEMAAAELELSHQSQWSLMDYFLQCQRYYGLTLRLGGYYEFPAQLVSDGFEEVLERNGAPILLSQGETHWLNSTKNQIEIGHASFTKGANFLIHTVVLHGSEYYPIDETQMFVQPHHCDLRDVYMDKEDFRDLQGSHLDKIPEWKNPVSAYYAPEMKLAEEAHQALIVEGKLNIYDKMEDRVHVWLIQNYPAKDKSRMGAQARRISIIIGKAKRTT